MCVNLIKHQGVASNSVLVPLCRRIHQKLVFSAAVSSFLKSSSDLI